MRARPASLGDAEAIAKIYNEGIADRIATFETDARNAAEPEAAASKSKETDRSMAHMILPYAEKSSTFDLPWT